MFGTKIAHRTARGMAVGALILSLGATTFAGSANAAPLADDKQDCSAAAHARNDAVHLLHTAWKVFNSDLKDLASDVRKLQHESRKDKASAVLTTDARAEVASAKQELMGIASKAHEDIQAAVELGSACTNEDEDTTTTTTTTTTGTTAPSDATAPADSHTFETSGLDDNYKKIVEDAIAAMQDVVDKAHTAVAEMAAAAETTDTTDDSKVKKDLETAKADREKAKEDREKAREDAKSADKAKAKSHGKDKADARSANHNEERD